MNITDNIYFVGVKNPDLRVFDVIMHTKYGTSYNAYVVKGKNKTALIETVKSQYCQKHIDMIAKIVDLDKIDYIVMNHTEPDHSGSLDELLKHTPKAKVVGSRAAINCLPEILNHSCDCIIAKDGEYLDLGGITLEFIMAPFLHWPDTMFTWVKEEKVLFTGDMFGCHFAGEDVFDTDFSQELIDAQKYYFDVIIGPFKQYALKAIDKIKDLDYNIICPTHGPVLKHQNKETVERFKLWSSDCDHCNEVKRVMIVYVSAYGYTRELAQTAKDHLLSKGFDARIYEITSYEPSELKAKIDKSDALLVGSPTFNRDALPPVWTLLMHLSAFTQKNMPAAAFGSYGWSGEAVAMLQARMKSLGMKVETQGYRTRFKPSATAIQDMKSFVDEFAETI